MASRCVVHNQSPHGEKLRRHWFQVVIVLLQRKLCAQLLYTLFWATDMILFELLDSDLYHSVCGETMD